MSDATYPIYALFWALDGLWNVIIANWLLVLSVALIFVGYGVDSIKRIYKKESK